jgi:hypothetical protein
MLCFNPSRNRRGTLRAVKLWICNKPDIRDHVIMVAGASQTIDKSENQTDE